MRWCTRPCRRASTRATARRCFSCRPATSSTPTTSDHPGVSDMRSRVASAATALIVLFFTSAPQAQSPHRDTYLYTGADRDRRGFVGARKPGPGRSYTAPHLHGSVAIQEALAEEDRLKIRL